MKTIKEYLDSLDLDASIKLHTILYLDEINEFCNKNKNKLNELPSTGQLEYMKLINQPEDLIEYIKHQSEKSTNKKWRTKVKHKDREVMFYEFLIDRIFNIDDNKKDSEKLKLMIKYFIEYLIDYIKMSRI